MALDRATRREIEEIVDAVLVKRLAQLQGGVVAGFVEAIDWYTDNLAKIFEAQTAERAAELRERLERLHAAPDRPRIEGFKP